jgi:DNA-3-methyladenine glycosylase
MQGLDLRISKGLIKVFSGFSSCVLGLFFAMLISSEYEIVPLAFFQRDDVVEIAKELIGMYLVHQNQDGLTGGKIVETEAYCGAIDKTCHAFGKRTPRTEVMYQHGGLAYIYLCYGMYHLFNIVTNIEGAADAVLIRAVEPMWGEDIMRERTAKKWIDVKLASGPGLVGKALGFHREQSGVPLGNNILVLRRKETESVGVISRTRIGVDYAGEDALLPWRFIMEGNKYVSKK